MLEIARDKKETFKYDHRWVEREDFKEVVIEAWKNENINRPTPWMAKIIGWNWSSIPSSAVRIQELHYQIDRLTRENPPQSNLIRELRRQLRKEYINEEKFWRLKSKITWLRGGDRNTKNFHAATKSRRAQNIMKSLVDDLRNEWFT